MCAYRFAVSKYEVLYRWVDFVSLYSVLRGLVSFLVSVFFFRG